MKTNPLELYIHIPFCVAKCAYCDFLSAPSDEKTKRQYMSALCQEIKGRKEEFEGRPITGIFIGGGTPSCLPEGCVEELFMTLRELNMNLSGAEITLEMNPGTVTEEKLREYQRAGVNRLSMGLQSAEDKELKLLGRIHTFAEFRENYDLARKLGFTNINVDIISGIPGQNWESFRDTLQAVISLDNPPEHVSVYSLIVEEGTPFYSLYGEKPELFVEEEEDRRIYHETESFLAKAGYEHYEISNYAKPGKACRHNIGYWTGTEYLGFGIGAASLMADVRFCNKRDLKEYLKNPLGMREITESLDMEDKMSEFVILGLRMLQGISGERFKKLFGRDISEVFGKIIEKNKADGLLVEEGDTIRLTPYGLDISNYVMSQFLL